ncbi:MAG: VanW family protein [Arthrobacter sp.]
MMRDKKDTSKKKKGWLIGGGAIILLAGAYAGGASLLGDQIPNGTTVHGVEIGGLSSSDAAARLHRDLDPLASEPVTIAAGEQSAPLTPDESGLGLDIEATLQGRTGYTLNPMVLFQRLTGGSAIKPVLTQDDDALDAAIEDLRPKLDTKATEGKIAFKDSKVQYDAPSEGEKVDADQAGDAIGNSWFGASEPIEVATTTVEPKTPASAFEKVRDEQAKPLVAGNVTVAADDLKATLKPAELAQAASFKVSDGAVKMSLDNQQLADRLLKANPKMASTAKDARIVLKGGKPKIIPAVKGHGVETKNLTEKILTAATTDSRTAKIDVAVTKPELTTAKAKKLGVKEVIVEFSTPYPTFDTVRTKNLRAGASKLNGMLVMPGDTFSLTKALAPITEANGYFKSGVVEDGFTTEAIGGGLSQISTQLFNVGWLGGMDDVTHRPHSRWFDRYPAGRESTLWEGQIDMAWKNNTGHAVMIQAWVTDSHVKTRLWGTKKYKVTSKTSGHYNKTNPKTTYNDAEKCVAESGGQKGFSVDVHRTRTAGSETLKDSLHWTYQPWNKVVCGKKP